MLNICDNRSVGPRFCGAWSGPGTFSDLDALLSWVNESRRFCDEFVTTFASRRTSRRAPVGAASANLMMESIRTQVSILCRRIRVFVGYVMLD